MLCLAAGADPYFSGGGNFFASLPIAFANSNKKKGNKRLAARWNWKTARKRAVILMK
jgi:hypothetical protein